MGGAQAPMDQSYKRKNTMRQRRKPTMKQSIFYKLYKEYRQAIEKKEDPRFVPVYELMGEIYMQELGRWGYVSYECSARASEIMKENPDLLQRQYITGKSGAKYYGYRFKPGVTANQIEEDSLKGFYMKIRHRTS